MDDKFCSKWNYRWKNNMECLSSISSGNKVLLMFCCVACMDMKIVSDSGAKCV